MASIPRLSNDPSCGDEIRTDPCLNCEICGAEGYPLYQGLTDRYFAAPGVWNMKKCQNAACGSVWLDPTPVEEDIVKAYQSYYTHSDISAATVANTVSRRFIRAIKAAYLASAYGYNNGGRRFLGLLAYLVPFRRALVDFAVMYLPYLSGGRLLEIGCGNGNMLVGMADLGWEVEGVDLDPAAVQNSWRKGLKVHVGLLQDLRYPDDCFDAITMSHLIEHVYDPFDLLQECHRILKPCGRLALVTPNINSVGHRIYSSSWFHLDPPRHLHIFTLGSLTALLNKAGFRRIRMKTTVRDADTAYLASRSVQRTGRYQMGSRQSWSSRSWGKTMQTIEWAWLKADRYAGEEIAAIAEK
jgi:2-polyprenyl-3-methyl-5-hydroxy-6-metoxy-1,4-benzoquinol methylase